MKTKTQLLIILMMACATASFAQSGIRRTTEKANETIKAVEESQESLESAVKLAKSLGDAFNLTRGRRAVILNVIGFEYDAQEIRSLSDALMREFNRRNVSGSYKAPVVSFEITTRNSAFDVWGMIPAEVASPFKVVEIGDGSIIIQREGMEDAVLPAGNSPALPASPQNQQAATAVQAATSGRLGNSPQHAGNFFRSDSRLSPGDVHPDAVTLENVQAEAFRSGAAVVRRQAVTGLIDAGGRFIIPLENEQRVGYVGGPYFGLSTTTYDDQNRHRITNQLINALGQPINTTSSRVEVHNSGEPYIASESLANAIVTEDGATYQFPGKLVDFSENTALVNKYERHQYHHAYFKHENGKWAPLTEFEFTQARPFSDGMAIVGKNDEFGAMKYGYIDSQGRLAIPYTFSRVPGNFHGGYASVRMMDDKQVYIDKNGNIAYTVPDAHRNLYFGSFQYGYAFTSGGHVLDSRTWGIQTLNEFLEGFGLPPNMQGLHKYGELTRNDFSGEMLFYNAYQKLGFANLRTGKAVPPIFEPVREAPYFDPVSGLTRVQYKYTESNGVEAIRDGFVNEDGIFVILIKQVSSIW